MHPCVGALPALGSIEVCPALSFGPSQSSSSSFWIRPFTAAPGLSALIQPCERAGTLAHYRNWSAQVQARYQMFNPEAIRPARRIYVGGLPNGTTEARTACAVLLTLQMCAQGGACRCSLRVCGFLYMPAACLPGFLT